MTDHLLSECDAARANGGYSRCGRCSEALANAAYQAHVKVATCKPTRDPALRCPLCHTDLPPVAKTVGVTGSGSTLGNAVEEIWRRHLIGTTSIGNGPICTQNSRQPKRVPASSVVLQKPSRVIAKPASSKLYTNPLLCFYGLVFGIQLKYTGD